MNFIDYDKLKNVPEGFQWDRDLKILYNLLENSNENIFITGNAGSGKSSLLKIFLKNTRKNFVVVAPTGVAAVNAGGTTIHSFFKLPPRVLVPEDVQNSPPIKNADKLDIVIVDEISMVRADIFDAIDLTLRKTGRYPTLPFGGAKMVIVGDLYQIPPIVTSDDKAAYSYYYKTPFFFSSRAFKEGDFRHVELTKIYRQKDQQFIDILNRIRIGKAEDADLRVLNETKYKVRGKDDKFVTLTATKKASQEINYSKLLELPGEVFQYNAHTTGIFKKENCPADDILLLKEGAQIMMCRNDSVDGRWVNGTLGKVVYLDQDKIKVELKNLKNGKLEIHTLDTVVWENVRYEWNGKTEKHEPITIGTLEQFPVKLAWSQTVHRCQGQTVEAADIDMGAGAFASGQTYVALSRCTSLDGIRLKRDIKHSDIIVDPKIRNFFLYLENKKLQEQTLE